MVTKKDMAVAILATFCLTSTLFMVIPIKSEVGTTSANEYDPWIDTNDDGIIDIFDIAKLALAFGAEGTPINKTALLLDLLNRLDALNATVIEQQNTINQLDSTVTYLNQTVVNLSQSKGLGVPDYDSGWMESQEGINHFLAHNLNTNASELLVYVLGMYADPYWGDMIHQWYYGGDIYTDPNGMYHYNGIFWDAVNNNTIRVCNLGHVYEYVRVKIWKIQQP